MAYKAGVWIDHKQAVVVLITKAGSSLKTIPAGKTSARKSTRNDFVAEDTLERKTEADRKSYFDEVLSGIHGADSLLLIGPGEAKGEFHKRLKAKKVRGILVEVETADKLTDRQLAAKVEKHFAASPAKKTAAVKKPVKKATVAVKKKSPKKKSK